MNTLSRSKTDSDEICSEALALELLLTLPEMPTQCSMCVLFYSIVYSRDASTYQ